MARWGSTGSSTGTRRGAATGSTRWGGGTTPTTRRDSKDRGPLWGILPAHPGQFPHWMYRLGSPLGYALEQSHIPYASGAGRALESLGATPVTVASAPKKTGKGAIQSVAGIVEAPYGAYKMHHAGVGWGDVGGALLKAFVDDYKRRYGKNWIAESKKEPFSQLMDALIPLGLATRGLAMGDAASRLKLADMPASLRNVLKETARPGIISRGEEIPRLLSYDAKAGKGMTSVQSFSRSPLRRGLQGLADEIAQ